MDRLRLCRAGAGLVEPPPLVAMTTSGSTRQAPSISMSARRGFWGLAPCSKGGDSAPSSSLGCRQLSTERSVSSAPKPCSGWVSSLHTSTPSISSTVSCAACLGRDAFAVGAFAVGASPSLSLSILRARRARASCAGGIQPATLDRLRATYLSIKLTSETTLPTCCDLLRCCTHKRGGHKPRSWCCTWLGVGVGVGVGVGETHCKHGLAHLVRGKGRGRGGGRGRVKVKRTSQMRQTAPRA